MHEIDLFESIGGAAKCRELATAFYARVAKDPVLRPFFPGKSFKCANAEFTAFLVQFLGGPSEQTQSRWWLSLRESHERFAIGLKERDAWMRLMTQTLDAIAMDDSMRGALLELFQHSSAYVV